MQSNIETEPVVEGEAPAKATRPYFPELDGVRAIAALMVMLFHFSSLWYFPRVMVFGQTGVDLFFVLSGFLITMILLQSPHGDWDEVRKFYIRRSLRIFPLYYGSLIVLTAVGWGMSQWYWAYLQNIADAFHLSFHGPTHYWSLAVEEQFYLVWPFLVLFWPRRWLGAAMWGTIVFAIGLRWALLPTHVATFTFTLTRLDGLAGGGVLAWLYLKGSLDRGKRLMGVLIVVALAVMAAQSISSHGTGRGWVEVTKFSSSALLYACVIGLLITTAKTPVHGFLRSEPMRAIGRVSYGLYVYHPFLYQVMHPHLAKLPPLLEAAIILPTVYAVAWLSWYGFEKRFTDFKQKLAPEKRFKDAVA